LLDEVVAGLAGLADRVVVGPGTVGTTNIGPVATRSAVADVRRYVENVLPEAGATAATSRQPLGDGDGYFVNPLVVRDPRRPGTLAASEIFAPVVTVCAAADLEEALSRGNESPYGLSAALWSTDAREIETFVRQCRAGMLSVNRSTTGLEPDKPFGGVGESGYGPRELGEQVLFFYSTGKTVNIRL
jgi:acyl-CoA reductase-like NAD-dependent aldehyde dehydrogenase